MPLGAIQRALALGSAPAECKEPEEEPQARDEFADEPEPHPERELEDLIERTADHNTEYWLQAPLWFIEHRYGRARTPHLALAGRGYWTLDQ